MDAETASFRALFTTLFVGLFSAGVVGAAAGVAAALKSNAVPGVFGVLLADPKDAKAPDPSPKAEEPPVVGDASAPGVNGEIPLNGLRPPCDDVLPKPFAVAENVRVGGCSDWWSDCVVDRESLLVLERRVQRFSLLSIGNELTASKQDGDYGDAVYLELGGMNERTSSRAELVEQQRLTCVGGVRGSVCTRL